MINPVASEHEEWTIARAFLLARCRRGRLSSVGGDRDWRLFVERLGAGRPEVEIEHLSIDAARLIVATDPSHFDRRRRRRGDGRGARPRGRGNDDRRRRGRPGRQRPKPVRPDPSNGQPDRRSRGRKPERNARCRLASARRGPRRARGGGHARSGDTRSTTQRCADSGYGQGGNRRDHARIHRNRPCRASARSPGQRSFYGGHSDDQDDRS